MSGDRSVNSNMESPSRQVEFVTVSMYRQWQAEVGAEIRNFASQIKARNAEVRMLADNVQQKADRIVVEALLGKLNAQGHSSNTSSKSGFTPAFLESMTQSISRKADSCEVEMVLKSVEYMVSVLKNKAESSVLSVVAADVSRASGDVAQLCENVEHLCQQIGILEGRIEKKVDQCYAELLLEKLDSLVDLPSSVDHKADSAFVNLLSGRVGEVEQSSAQNRAIQELSEKRLKAGMAEFQGRLYSCECVLDSLHSSVKRIPASQDKLTPARSLSTSALGHDNARKLPVSSIDSPDVQNLPVIRSWRM